MDGLSLTIDANGELKKFSYVLGLNQVSDHGVLVTYKSSGEGRLAYITFPKSDYVELGEPSQITVTVEPGNTLQEEYDEEQARLDEEIATARDEGADESGA